MGANPDSPEEISVGEYEVTPQTACQLLPAPQEIAEGESFELAFEKARRLVAAELELAQTRVLLLEGNLKITEAQLELAERQLDQLVAENEHLRQENDALRRRLGESA